MIYRAGRGDKFLPSISPEVITSIQWREMNRSEGKFSPEQRLMLAVLTDGVEAIQKNLFAQRPKGKAAFASAMDWLMSEDEKWTFSFRNVCTFLGLEAEYMRDGIIEWCSRTKERTTTALVELEQSQP